MSRELKVKAWLKDAKCFAEVRHISFFEGNTVIKIYDQPMSEEIWFDLEELELLQYTGLKDKNGVEIYEGDIVEAYFWNDKLKPVKERGFIEFQSGSFIFNFGNGTWEYLDGNDAALVIGSIYENPELLEEER